MIATTEAPTWRLRPTGWVARFEAPDLELHLFVGLGRVLAAFWVSSRTGRQVWTAAVGEA